jgi:hypothetical protein
VPGYGHVGGRTNRGVRRRSFGRFRRHLLYLLSRLIKRSRAKRPEGSLPAFAWGDLRVLGNPYPPHYRAAFAFSLILCQPCHQAPLRESFLCSGV